MSWLLCHPKIELSVPANRCREEFMTLFRLRFNARFPQGVKAELPSYKSQLEDRYQALSGEFNVGIRPMVNGNKVSDILCIRDVITEANEIYLEAMFDLDKFSRYIGRHPDRRESIEAHALLPVELRLMLKSEQLAQIKIWADDVIGQGGLIPFGDVLLRMRIDGMKSANLDGQDLADIEHILIRLGFGIAPDLRPLRTSQLDELVVLFNLSQWARSLEEIFPISSKYKSALTRIEAASFVAQSGGMITDTEQKILNDRISSSYEFSEHEQQRLQANIIWFLAVPPDMSQLRRKLKKTNEEQRFRIRKTLVAVAQADDIVQPEKITALKEIYHILGLDTNLVHSDLQADEISDARKRARVARLGNPDWAVPNKRSKRKKTLDAKRIARIQQDTEHVSADLAEIFSVARRGNPDQVAPNKRPRPKKSLDAKRIALIQQDTERVSANLAEIFSAEENDKVADEGTPSILRRLDEKHDALVNEIITRTHWSHDEFDDLVARHGLMAAGALETINEWAFEIYDEALIEEYQGYDIAPDIADALAEDLKKAKN